MGALQCVTHKVKDYIDGTSTVRICLNHATDLDAGHGRRAV
jgi:hypothetical protein